MPPAPALLCPGLCSPLLCLSVFWAILRCRSFYFLFCYFRTCLPVEPTLVISPGRKSLLACTLLLGHLSPRFVTRPFALVRHQVPHRLGIPWPQPAGKTSSHLSSLSLNQLINRLINIRAGNRLSILHGPKSRHRIIMRWSLFSQPAGLEHPSVAYNIRVYYRPEVRRFSLLPPPLFFLTLYTSLDA